MMARFKPAAIASLKIESAAVDCNTTKSCLGASVLRFKIGVSVRLANQIVLQATPREITLERYVGITSKFRLKAAEENLSVIDNEEVQTLARHLADLHLPRSF
jgi:hypothetical protein